MSSDALRVFFRVVDFSGEAHRCSCRVKTNSDNLHDVALGVVVRNYMSHPNNGIREITLQAVEVEKEEANVE